ncbi:hypothetical protein RO575_02620 [Methylomonas sp. MO1]|uniref:hypothetical protein n=1 Tax=Methylomonas sp. MO1 TaxID=3073619 RepID=UPI0028A54A0E|nr:hypothetical protein [Methylomonas sp. MO1]MDT4288443.1 hypothetical protein [Methylomonas sp. MO1]
MNSAHIIRKQIPLTQRLNHTEKLFGLHFSGTHFQLQPFRCVYAGKRNRGFMGLYLPVTCHWKIGGYLDHAHVIA